MILFLGGASPQHWPCQAKKAPSSPPKMFLGGRMRAHGEDYDYILHCGMQGEMLDWKKR